MGYNRVTIYYRVLCFQLYKIQTKIQNPWKMSLLYLKFKNEIVTHLNSSTTTSLLYFINVCYSTFANSYKLLTITVKS